MFDLGDNWQHRCTVEPEKADPLEEYGSPERPVAIWGGDRSPTSGRRSFDDDGEDEDCSGL